MPALEQFHPMILHFPIVLIMVLAAFDLVALFRGIPLGGRDTYASIATVLAVATGIAAALTAMLGDMALEIALTRGFAPGLFETHEALGWNTAIAFGIWALIRAGIWWRQIPLEGGRKWGVGAVDVALVLFVVSVAYFGGQLVYDHGVNVIASAN
ncbi:DUF2231 domain-containing protein [Nioella nitratireducens]|uniref:DUF2231 domain-containing protein n=1 Tax=Nioella nitratireducens TaxID=1287720 RepID=UPI0011BA9074|nr:DUF2231 domain-containing protein [Nioella nitratireducens]